MGHIIVPDTIHQVIKELAHTEKIPMGKLIEKQFRGELNLIEKIKKNNPNMESPNQNLHPDFIPKETKEDKDIDQPSSKEELIESFEDKKPIEVDKPEEKQPDQKGRLNIEEKVPENKEKTEEQPVPPEKEKIMEEKDKEFISNLVNKVKEDVTQKYEGLAKTVQNLKANPANPAPTVAEKTSSGLTAEDVIKILDKREATKAESEAVKREEARKKEEAKKLQQTLEELKKMTQQQKKEFDDFCTLNPENEKCKAFTEALTKQLAEASKPKEEKPEETKKKEAKEKVEEVIKALPKINEETREKLSKEDIEKRTAQVAEVMDKLNLTPVDAFNVLWGDPRDKKGLIERVAGEPEAAESILKTTEAKKLISACNLGDEESCKVVEDELEKQGYALMKKDEKGKKKWNFVNPDLSEESHF